MTNYLSKFKKVSVLLFTIIIVLSLFVLFSVVRTQAEMERYDVGDTSIRHSDGNSPQTIFIATQQRDNLRKIFALENTLIKNDISFYTFSAKSDDHSSMTDTINSTLQDLNLSKSDVIMIGYGRAGYYAMEEGYFASVSLAPYLIPSDINTPSQPLLIQGVLSDDNATTEMLTHLYNLLSGDNIGTVGFAFSSSNENVTLSMSSGTANSYQSFSADVITDISDWLVANGATEIAGNVLLYQNITLLISAVIILSAIALAIILSTIMSARTSKQDWAVVMLTVCNSKAFVAVRLFVWVLALPIILILGGLVWIFVPVQTPIDLLFALYIFGTGIIMLRLYKKGQMPGVSGSIDYRKMSAKLKSGKSIALLSMICSVLIFGIFHLIGFYGISLNLYAILTSLIFIFMLFPGFYVFSWELSLLEDINANPYMRYAYMFTMYIPLLVMALISIPMDQGQSFVISLIYIMGLLFSLCQSILIYSATQHQLFTAILTSVLYGSFLGFTIL